MSDGDDGQWRGKLARMLGHKGRRGAVLGRAAVPDGTRVYCLGDIHGRADLLGRALTVIAQDAAGYEGKRVLVTLGDYVDRGPDAAAVLDILAGDPLPGATFLPLMGNHEVMLLTALIGEGDPFAWLSNGGDATLASYGLDWRDLQPERGFPHLGETLARSMPKAHVAFLRRCTLKQTIGDYLFVHAGIRPGVPLDEQRAEDLVGIRRPFLSSEQPYEKVIVHGHTISEAPQVCPNRIGLDTGAYVTGVLTCLRLEGREYSFLPI